MSGYLFFGGGRTCARLRLCRLRVWPPVGRCGAAMCGVGRQIDDTLLRALLWRSLFDSVRDGEWSSSSYLHLVRSNIIRETDIGA